ncbi:MAG: hypothetical protein RLZZ380_83 [Actinomycetota bacterium]|jgi:pyruvate,water dikinase
MAVNLGAKAVNLLRLKNEFGLNVPDFEAISFSEIISDFPTVSKNLESVIDDFLSGKQTLKKTSTTISNLLASLCINEEVCQKHFEKIKVREWKKVSYRTSAALEDGSDHSFAGQYETFLNLDFTAENLASCAFKSFESLVAPKVLNYAKERGFSRFEIAGSLVIQEMFFGSAAGVLFTENGSAKIQIAYSKSWRNTVVEGEDAHELLVDRTKLRDANLPWQLLELCEKALVLENDLETPLDIEWAYDMQELVFLQFRPITQRVLEHTFDWDSTNISENYPGLTLPLTYSLIRQFYSGVYLAFFKKLGATNEQIEDKKPIADNMLGYLNGRVYYRISNWYEAVKLIPGSFNQEFFEGMLNPVKKRGKADRTRYDLKSAIVLIRFMRLLMGSERASQRFGAMITEKIAFYDSIDFSFINASAILEAGKRARVEILNDWSTTILNDIRLMVFNGLMQRFYAKNDNPNDYLVMIQGLNDKASIRPLEALSKLGAVIAQALALEGVTNPMDLQGTAHWPTVKQATAIYISQYGARTPGELKLENTRISDEIATVLTLALKASESGISSLPHSEKRAEIWPVGFPRISRFAIRWVAKNTRQAIDWRERFRFNRAQTFNLSRKAFDALGQIFEDEGLIDERRDIYWLTDQEIDELVNAHSPVLSGKESVALRKAKFKEYEKLSHGLAVSGSGKIASLNLSNNESFEPGSGLNGNGVAPGVVTGEAIVVRDFDPNLDVRGKVLVVNYIDPGWTLLFTQAAAIVAERGNALSHAAIIAREIGIPAVVAATSATTQIASGQVITVNGTTGSITHEKV